MLGESERRRIHGLILATLLHSGGPLLMVFLAERPTPTTRQVSSRGPPPQVLRDPGQPRSRTKRNWLTITPRLFHPGNDGVSMMRPARPLVASMCGSTAFASFTKSSCSIADFGCTCRMECSASRSYSIMYRSFTIVAVEG